MENKETEKGQWQKCCTQWINCYNNVIFRETMQNNQ